MPSLPGVFQLVRRVILAMTLAVTGRDPLRSIGAHVYFRARHHDPSRRGAPEYSVPRDWRSLLILFSVTSLAGLVTDL